MPGKPYQSKLIEYEDFIRKARKEGMSYNKIAVELFERFGFKTGHNTVFSFVKVRSKKRKVYTMLNSELKKDGISSNPKINSIDKIKDVESFYWGEKVFTYDRSKPIT